MFSDKTYIELAYRFTSIDIPAFIECVNYSKRLMENQDVPKEIRYKLIMDKYDNVYENSCYSIYENILDASLPLVSSFSSPNMHSYAKVFQETSSALQNLLLDSIWVYESLVNEDIEELEWHMEDADADKARFDKLLPQTKNGYYNALLSIDGKDPLKTCDFLYNVLIKKYIEIEKLAEKETRRIFHKVDYVHLVNLFSSLILLAKEPYEDIQYLCKLNLKVNEDYLRFIFRLKDTIVSYVMLCNSKMKIYQYLKTKSETLKGDIHHYNSLVQSSDTSRDTLNNNINALLPEYKSLLEKCKYISKE